MGPNAIVSHRLLRDVLLLSTSSSRLQVARQTMLSHAWVEELAHGQHPDGTWGRFHSMDSSIKSRFPTSEAAIHRALALGLDKDSHILARVVEFMQKVLEGKATWSDRMEKSEGWAIAVETITAAILAEVDPSDPAIDPTWEYWSRIAARSFPRGEYDPSAEWKAHKELRGIGINYLHSRYVLSLLGSQTHPLPTSLDYQVVDWIWNNPVGIGYLGVDLQHPHIFHIFHWLESLEILSRFQSTCQVIAPALAWLWDQRNPDGLWDFGTRVSKSIYFPLSDGWRKRGNRALDHSTRVLALLRTLSP